MIKWGLKEVGGTIIGGYYITGTLHKYDTGVQQGPTFCGNTDEDVLVQAKRWFAHEGGLKLWPDGLELRLR